MLTLNRPLATGFAISLAAFAAVHSPSARADMQWNPPVAVATGQAHAGPWKMNDSDFHYVTDATAALREDGSVIMAWVDNSQQDIFLQQFSPQDQPRFDEPVNVSRSPDIFSWLPSIEARGQSLYVLWQEIIFSGGSHGGEILFARSGESGREFSEPLNLSNTRAGAGKGRLTEEHWDNGSLDLLSTNNNHLFVAWTEYEGGLWFRRSVDGGQSFEESRQLGGTQLLPARAPALAQSDGGVLYLAWTVGEDKAADIRLAVSQDDGKSFTKPKVIATNTHADTPALTVTPNGELHVVYAESLEGPFAQSHLRHMTFSEQGDVTQKPKTISSFGSDNTSAEAPAIATDRAGNLYVIWEHHPLNESYGRGLGFSYSINAGEQFSEPVIIPGSMDDAGGVNGSLQGELGHKLAVNSQGQLVVTNSHFDPGNRSRVIYIRGKLRSD